LWKTSMITFFPRSRSLRWDLHQVLVGPVRGLRPSDLKRGPRPPDSERGPRLSSPERRVKPFDLERCPGPRSQDQGLSPSNRQQGLRSPDHKHNPQLHRTPEHLKPRRRNGGHVDCSSLFASWINPLLHHRHEFPLQIYRYVTWRLGHHYGKDNGQLALDRRVIYLVKLNIFLI